MDIARGRPALKSTKHLTRERRPDILNPAKKTNQVATVDQAGTDHCWNAIVGNGGEERARGWCKDGWGRSWQVTPGRSK